MLDLKRRPGEAFRRNVTEFQEEKFRGVNLSRLPGCIGDVYLRVVEEKFR
jgi:hypothetical protein